MTKADKFIIYGTLFLALLTLVFSFGWLKTRSQGEIVVIKAKGQPQQEIRLNEIQNGQEIKVQGLIGTSVLKIEDEEIRFIDSPCRDKICVRRGWIQHHGEAAVCVPNQVSVEIIGKRSDLDDVTR
ncbi:NusG domain II-containing protein [Bacillota bacterium LX-D]|nr:NusG domain II-containing protein [Bacillota bacterium LX-D]